jgi:hypothetical protein
MGWNRGGVKESIELINPAGLVEYGNITALSEKISQFREIPAPESIPNIFTKEYLANATIKIYDLALAREK